MTRPNSWRVLTLALVLALVAVVGPATASARDADARGAKHAKATGKKSGRRARATARGRKRRASGRHGRTGPRGPKGERGSRGPKGDAGPRGDRGDAGARGEKGETGSQGAKGDDGREGPKGDTGPQGPGAKGFAVRMTATAEGVAAQTIGRTGPYTLSATCEKDPADEVSFELFVFGPASVVDGFITGGIIGGTNTSLVTDLELDPSRAPVSLGSVTTALFGGANAYYQGNIFGASGGGIHAEATFVATRRDGGSCRIAVVHYPFTP